MPLGNRFINGKPVFCMEGRITFLKKFKFKSWKIPSREWIIKEEYRENLPMQNYAISVPKTICIKMHKIIIKYFTQGAHANCVYDKSWHTAISI